MSYERMEAVDAYPGPHERREKVFLVRDGREFEVECVCTSDGEVTCERAEWLDSGDEVELNDDETHAAAVKAWRGEAF